MFKKELLPISLALTLAGSTQGLAAVLNAPDINVENNTVKISGNIDKEEKLIELIVLNPDGTTESVAVNASDLQYQRLLISGKNGEFSHTFKLNLDGVKDSGVYTVIVGGQNVGDKPLTTEFYFASAKDVADAISGITASGSVQEVALILNDDMKAKTLSVASFEPFAKQDKTEIAKVLYGMTSSWSEEEKNNCTGAVMQKTIYEASLICAYNTGNTALIFDENGEFLHDDVLGVSNIDEDNDITLLQVYKETVSKDGQKKIREALLNNTYKNADEMKKSFAENIVLIGLTNSEKNGFAHVDKILTDKNVKYVGLTINKTLTDDNKIALKEANGYSSIDVLQKAINDLPTGSSSSPSGSSGSSGSSSNKKPSSNIGNFVVDYTNAPSSVTSGDKFNDLTNHSWAKEAITSLYEDGIINGVGENEFDPSGYLTREQAVKILCEATGKKPVNEKTDFKDVDNNAWYAGYVAAAKKSGLVNGISDKEFGVGKKISRQDFAVMIARAFSISENSKTTDFADNKQIADYAQEAVAALSARKVINGYADNTFKPFENCTRAEAAVIIYRVLGGNA